MGNSAPSTSMSRRELLKTSTAVPLAVTISGCRNDLTGNSRRLPAKDDFPQLTGTCLNNARWHPMSIGAIRAVESYLQRKSRSAEDTPEDPFDEMHASTKSLFAELINAKANEISYVPSTVAGENLIVTGLGVVGSGGNIVTDALHYEGSLYLYEQLAIQGVDVRIVRPREWRIDMRDIESVVDKNTKLIAVSLVSYINGFQHELKGLCQLAHAHQAYVYADIVQAVGAMPFDVRSSGVDFCACSTYKWLMGDMGIGFLYVREDLLQSIIRRTQYGQRQIVHAAYHIFPGDPPGHTIMDWSTDDTASHHFEVGTLANAPIAALSYSLPYIQKLGLYNIQDHARSLTRKLQEEMPRLGFPSMTPPDAAAHIVTFIVKDRVSVAARLKDAKINASLYGYRLRISPSVYNDLSDIDRLLEALS